MCTCSFGDDEFTSLSRSMVSMVDGEICNKNIVIDLKYIDVITSSFDFVPRKSFHGEIVFF